jgi:hypothetical protein
MPSTRSTQRPSGKLKPQLFISKVNQRIQQIQSAKQCLPLYRTEHTRLQKELGKTKQQLFERHKGYVEALGERDDVDVATFEQWNNVLVLCKQWIEMWQRRITVLEHAIEEIECGQTEVDFHNKVGVLVRAYEKLQQNQTQQLSSEDTIQKLAFTAEEYQAIMGTALAEGESHATITQEDILKRYDEKFEGTPIVREQTAHKLCPHCNCAYVDYMRDCLLVCPQCGRSKPYMMNDERLVQHSDASDMGPPSYNRMSHFRERINVFQAKQQREIPQEVRDAVEREFRIDKMYKPEKITRERVRRYLKRLKMPQWYDDDMLIACQLGGKQPPSLTQEQTKRLYSMFEAVQAPYDRCPVLKKRKNFFNYNYLIYKLIELNGWYELLPFFPPLKSGKNRAEQDVIWAYVCKELNWPFYSCT